MKKNLISRVEVLPRANPGTCRAGQKNWIEGIFDLQTLFPDDEEGHQCILQNAKLSIRAGANDYFLLKVLVVRGDMSVAFNHADAELHEMLDPMMTGGFIPQIIHERDSRLSFTKDDSTVVSYLVQDSLDITGIAQKAISENFRESVGTGPVKKPIWLSYWVSFTVAQRAFTLDSLLTLKFIYKEASKI